MLSEAVLVEWMDILSSAGVKVREFSKNFFAFFFFLRMLISVVTLYSFFFFISPGPPLCVS